ncbi:MAG TPA: SpoIIE family protein phosphatase [Dissulfurispiraceae bacterium]|nr:SpoIIE family protein phosphatase [Dissulfurispiraceae bacterium]
MIDRAERNFIEVDYHHTVKNGQVVSGDIFLSNKIREEGRIVAVLADGLGSGIKASVLATLTATMALKYTSSSIDFRTSAEVIMDTLPICSERKVSYSTFTIVDVNSSGKARIIEHGNPPYIFIHGRREVPVEKQEIILKKWSDRVINYSELHMERGDRIVFFSDGVSQAGLGNRGTPMGWGKGVSEHVEQCLRVDGEMSAWSMSRGIVKKASWMDGKGPYDDITCGVIYLRRPRQLLVVTGPPFSMEQDTVLAQLVKNFPGRKVICGGTTADIIARELDCDIAIDPRLSCSGMPPAGRMEGVDLVTEGALTIGRTAAMLESGLKPNEDSCDPASLMAAMLLDSDLVHFVVGTRVNEAHQDPRITVDLDLRRNIVRRIAGYLEKNYFKETRIKYI